MTNKTLTISEEAYKNLVALKEEGESFSDVINRITELIRKKPPKRSYRTIERRSIRKSHH
jgi:predicted CopG family antitoxin